MGVKNIELRNTMRNNGIRHWEVAERLGMAESTLCRKMRTEFPPELKEKAMQTIKEIVSERMA